MAPSATIPDREPDEFTLPPFLRRVRIRGYKSVGFCDVLLHPLTILVGRNAAGKSNFLDALAFLADTITFGVGEAVKRRNGWNSIVSRISTSKAIEIEIEAGYTCGRLVHRFDGSRPPVSWQQGIVRNLVGVSFTATYGLTLSTGPQSIPAIIHESLTITDSANNSIYGFDVDNGIIRRWLPVDTAAPDSSSHPRDLAIQRPDLPLLAVLGNQPYLELAEGLRSMAFYNFHPDSVRALQQPNPGSYLEKDGRNLASVIDGLNEIDADSIGRVKDYLVSNIGGFGETLPYHENKVTLDKTRKDKWGLNILAMDIEYKDNEKKMRQDMKNDGIEILTSAGVKNVKGYDGNGTLGRGIHEMGSARMGKDPKSSVLNKWNQIWDSPNVFVTDGSFMVSSSCVNPSLSYMAFTARAADHAVSELKKGNI